MPTMSSTWTPIPGSEFSKGALKVNTPPSAPTRKYPLSPGRGHHAGDVTHLDPQPRERAVEAPAEHEHPAVRTHQVVAG